MQQDFIAVRNKNDCATKTFEIDSSSCLVQLYEWVGICEYVCSYDSAWVCVCVCLGGIFMPQRSAWHNKQWKNNIVSSVAANLAHLRVSFERWKRKQNLHIKTKTQMN